MLDTYVDSSPSLSLHRSMKCEWLSPRLSAVCASRALLFLLLFQSLAEDLNLLHCRYNLGGSLGLHSWGDSTAVRNKGAGPLIERITFTPFLPLFSILELSFFFKLKKLTDKHQIKLPENITILSGHSILEIFLD